MKNSQQLSLETFKSQQNYFSKANLTSLQDLGLTLPSILSWPRSSRLEQQPRQFSLALKACHTMYCSALIICVLAKKQTHKKGKLKRNSGFCSAFEEV